MTSPDVALVALVAGTALHAGFQLTVTLVVYPALARLGADRWQEGHAAHGRAVTPVVAVVYAALALGCGGALVVHPAQPWVLAAVASSGVAVLATALVAAPTHGRLSTAPEPALVRRLLVADRVRAFAAVAAVVASMVAAVTTVE